MGYDYWVAHAPCMRRFRFDPLVYPNCSEWVKAIRKEVDQVVVSNVREWLWSRLRTAGKWAFKQSHRMALANPASALELSLRPSGHSPAPTPWVVHMEVHGSTSLPPHPFGMDGPNGVSAGVLPMSLPPTGRPLELADVPGGQVAGSAESTGDVPSGHVIVPRVPQRSCWGTGGRSSSMCGFLLSP